MRFAFASLCVVCFLAAGCGEPAAGPAAPVTPPANSAVETETPATPAAMETPDATEGPQLGAAGSTPPALPSLPVPDGFTPVALEGGKAMLSQDNTLIQFVGKHTQGGEDDPMARIGIFEKFSGEVVIDPATKTLISAMAEIDTTTLYTPIGNLTNHLKNHEFLDVEVHPTAKFVSTRVEPGDEPGKYNVIGNLTLHGVTKEITIPASVTVDDAGVTVHAQTKLKRSDFGITHEAINERIMPEVDLTLAVGKRTERP